jgi:formate dehydrogenase major subunit
MTNGWVDIKNADLVFVMGGNPAENHPCGFKWALEAKKNRGAKIVCVDPRYQRTAAVSDAYAPLRAGTDIAFLHGIIRYAGSQALPRRHVRAAHQRLVHRG